MMCFKRSASIIALMAAGAIAPQTVRAQQSTVVQGASVTISPSSANILNLLSPYLGLNATSVGQATLATNLSQVIAINNGASISRQALGESDENLLGSGNGTALRTQATGFPATALFGVAANLGGGLPGQAVPAGGTVAPAQAVGGLGAVLGAAYDTGINSSTTTNNGPLSNVAILLNDAYSNFTSANLGVAKNYFANGGANNTSSTVNGVTTYTTNPAVAPTGYNLPTFNGLPNTTNSVYDLAYGVTNGQPNQDVFGSSRPDQVASSQVISVDPTALNGISTNPSFPSGHTTYAYTDSILLAMLVPQEYQSMLYRASAYATSRIVVGVHYPLDLIAGRALASYDLAQAFTNPLYINNATTTGKAINLPAELNAASARLTPYLTAAATNAGCGTTLAACAASTANTTNDPYAVGAQNAAAYTANLTYGLPILTFAQAPREQAPSGGPDASILLAPVYGGSTTAATAIAPKGGLLGSLSTATIDQIIVNTENNALAAFYGTSLSYWTRIDLAAAAGYFGNVTGTTSLAATDVVNTPVSIGAAGVLDANGTINGSTAVTSTGTLTGSGVINGGVTVNAGGTLAPGSLAAQSALAAGTASVPGTRLTVHGGVSFAPGSNYGVFASPAQVTSMVVTTATLGGIVNVTLPTSGPFVTSKNNLIVQSAGAGGLTGTFTGVTSNLLFATPTLSYDPNNAVFLSFGTPNFAVAAGTRNETNVANGLSHGAAINPNAALPAAIEFFAPGQAAQARPILDSLSGEGITAAQNVAHLSTRLFTDSIMDQTTFYAHDFGGNSITLVAPQPGGGSIGVAPTQYTDGRPGPNGAAPVRELADLPAPRPTAAFEPVRTWRVWGTGFGGTDDIHGNGVLGTATQSNTIYGGTVGVDYQLLPNFLAGVAVGGSNGDFSVPNRATSGSTTGGHIAFYDLASFAGFYGALTASGSFYQNRTTRNVVGFGALASETEKGSFFSDEFRTRFEVGRQLVDGVGFGRTGVITPFVAMELAQLRSNSFGEQAIGGPGVFALNVSGQSTADVPAFVGARFQQLMALGNGTSFAPTLQLAYVHEFAPYRQQFATLASLPGSTFLVDGARPARNAGQVKAGGELAIGPRSVIFFNFDGEFSRVEEIYAGKGGFKYLF